MLQQFARKWTPFYMIRQVKCKLQCKRDMKFVVDLFQKKDDEPSLKDNQSPVQNVDNYGGQDARVSAPHIHQRREEIQMPLTQGEKLFKTVSLILKILLWVILWALFVEIGFGAVFFIVSSLIIIYRTMKSGSRDHSQLSAYSVFNPNFERLEGTFTAEQFEKELRYGAASVR